ncbi:MAG: Ig-like domain-containing protein [Oscillospiraceae bacterium]|nr:Ig-like domain-containing protein [Oscillospiraceae bacterium]
MPINIAVPASSAAPDAKEGYTLEPLVYGKTGVDTASPFKLTTPLDVEAAEIGVALSIDGQPAPGVEQSTKREFLITPAAELMPNSLYIFRLSRVDGADITWAFQTAIKFQVASGYPRNQATNVPINSGIEITFSSDGYSPIDRYFDISPQVGGSFEYHKETAVFVPKGRLEYKTLYTVTLKAGVRLEGTNTELQSDYVFAFETEAEPSYEPPTYKESVSFYYGYAELPTIEPPLVGFSIYHDRIITTPDPKVAVYKFGGAEAALSAVETVAGAPTWSRYARNDNLIETGGMQSIMEFNARSRYDADTRTLTLPDKLTQGFYLIDAVLGESRSQMIVQITDLPVQVVADGDRAIVWVNDLTTGKASAGAEVRDVKGGKTFKTDANGVAVIDRALTSDRSERIEVTDASGGKTCIWTYSQSYGYYYGYDYGYGWGGPYYGAGAGGAEAYWTALQLDRTLFKADDTVSFFGFAQSRDNGSKEEINNVTAVLTQSYWSGGYSARSTLHKQTVQVINGMYSDEMILPNLDPGSYNINIYHGDTVLGSTYFEVRDYVKPPYKIEVEADKKAAFAGESVTFTARAEFFEGTPLPDLDISYNIYAYMLENNKRGTATTDSDGLISITQKITPQSGAQGERSISFRAEATLPEIGETYKETSVRAFINDIDVRPKASRTGGRATLEVDVNSITLDRINSGAAEHYFDYLDEPVGGKSLSVNVYRVYYLKVPDGDYYDYIEKKNMPKYKYERKEESIDRFTMLTDRDGNAKKDFNVPDNKWESYFAEISCLDGNGREIKHKVYIGRDYTYYYQNAGSNTCFLEGEEENYGIGAPVSLTLMRGAEAVAGGNFLFVEMQRGIQGWQAGKNTYSTTFSRKHVPNITVKAYYFDGFKYIQNYNMSALIRYDFKQNDLALTVTTDKESYKPGDTCIITVVSEDKDGLAVPAGVNISVVDEALFALRDYSVDTLASLYALVGPGVVIESATHRLYVPSEDVRLARAAGGADQMEMAAAPLMAMADGDFGDGASADDTYLREIFKDTAFFETLQTGADGKATYTFVLPDNITSWRLTASGVSNDLYAGNSVSNIIVTNPMFINYTLNDEFLIGDKPAIGVNAYGTGLTGGETVEFEVWDEAAPDAVFKASGKAFERVDIPLWEMASEGENALIIKATVSGVAGLSDSVKHQYLVRKTYLEVDFADYYDVAAGMAFSESGSFGSGGLVRITFTDKGRGAYLQQLLGLRYIYGDRVEKLLARREANRLLAEYFPDVKLYGDKDGFDLRLYQRDDGGLAILPHAESDLTTTVKLMPYIMEDVNTFELKNYLYNIYNGENADNKMCALYGLAMLREPVLLDLDSYAELGELSVRDAVYLALGYLSLGETDKAAALYDKIVAPGLENIAPYYRVNVGDDNDDILAATSAATILAVKLDRPENEGLYQYCVRNHTTDILINIETLTYINHEIAKKNESVGKVTYSLFGDEHTIELKSGRGFTIMVPSQRMGEFKVLDSEGEVGAVVSYKAPMTQEMSPDKDIKVERIYYKEVTPDGADLPGGGGAAGGPGSPRAAATTFNQGDLVRVELKIDYTAKAIDGSYIVTDYLPSGLAFVNDSAKISDSRSFGYGHYRYCTLVGQKVMFYDYNSRFNRNYTYYYYARVINPGTFKAEGTFVQNLTASDYYTVGNDATITINP